MNECGSMKSMKSIQEILPIISKCRDLYGQSTLVLNIQFIRLNPNDAVTVQQDQIGLKLGEKSENVTGCVDKRNVYAICKEVLHMTAEPCIHVNDLINKMTPIKQLPRGDSVNEQQYQCRGWTDKTRSECFIEVLQSNTINNEVNDELLLRLIDYTLLVCIGHCPTVVSVDNILITKLISGDLYILCEQYADDRMRFDVRIFDGNGWKVVEIVGITIGNEEFSGTECNSNGLSINKIKRSDTKELAAINGNQRTFEGANEEYFSNCECAQKHLNEIRERIKQILSRFIDLEYQQDEKTFIWLGLDSLKMATFEVNLKTEFANDFNVPYGCTFRYRTVSMLTEYFESLKHLKSVADGNDHSGSDSNTKKFDAIATGNDNGCKYEENNNFIALDFDKIDRKLRRLILKGGLIPLSASQSRLIFMAKLEPENDAQFIEKVTLKLTNLNIKRLATALNQLVSHQTILRTTCTSSNQVVLSLSESYFAVRVMDDSQYRMRSSEQLTVFDASVLRILLQKTEASFILQIIQHHIATDGTSIAILMRELKNAYEGQKIEKLSFHYAHFALLEELQLSDQTYVKNRQKFWTEQFKNFETEKLLTDKPRQSMQTYNGAVATYQLSGSELAKVKDIASQLEVTQFATLLSIYHLFLCVVCDRSDYCTGTAISQRNNAYTEKLAGCLVNILPIRLQVDSSKSVGKMIIDSANLINECVQNQLPFERILNLLNLTRDISSSPLFQILIVMDNIINASDLQNESSQSGDLSLQAELIEEQSKYVKYDQIWYFRSIGDCLTIEVEYNTDLFYKSSVEKTIREFVHTVRIAAGSLHDSIGSIELQTNKQKLQNYTDRLKNRNDFPMNLAAGDIFQSQLSMSASTNCVVVNRLLYSSIFLNRRSNCLAHVINTKFVEHWGTISRSDTPIILLMNRSVEMILFVMSLWKCGFTVVPLSIDWPERRYHDTVKSLPYSTIITADDFIESTQLPSGCLYISISTVLKDSTTCSTKAIRTKQSVYDIGYITYTSGSTGLGKGVLSEMIGLNNLAANYTRCLALNSESVVYQLANHSFDIFFADLVEAFANGATLQLARRRVPDPKEMHSVTHAYVMPAYLSQLDDTKMNQFEKLEAINFGGDSIDTNVLANAIDRGICLYHQYGTTETAVLSTMRKMRLFDTNNSVGHPMRNIHFTVRNSNMKLIPPTRRGICCIDGVGVSRGYLDNRRLNAERYRRNGTILKQDDLLRYDQRYFVSGDLLESDVNGQFKFFGRADRQVKIRGQIVDMNELEAALSSISTVESCIITSRMQKKSCVLIAHCIVNDQYKNSTSEQIQNLLRDILVDKIPNFMIPSYFHFIDSFPLTSNGKIDRQRLDADVPMIENSRKTDDQTLVQMTDSEKKVCQIFGDVLEVDSVTLKDSFFALGGDSLKALLAIGRIEDELSIEIPLKSVFHCKTFREILDSQIKRCHEPKGVDSESSQQLIRSEGISDRFWLDANGIPLSYAQQTLWFVQNYEQSTPLSYVLRSKIRLRGKVHLKALNATINFVMRQHQILRTIFVVRRGSVSQLVTSLTESYVSLIEGDPCNVDGGCYDLQNSPPLKIFMQRYRNGIDLHLYLHHILTDAQTYTIILKHLIEIYEWIVLDDINTSFSSIRSTIQQSYALYSYQQRKSFNNRMDGEMQQWVEQLRNEEALEIPADSIRPKVFETRGRILRVDINIKRDEIGGFCSRYNCTQFTYLLAAYALVMRTLSGQRRFVIGTPTANRSAKFMDTVGFFVNSVPLIIDTEFVNLVEFIESLKQMFSTALQHQHVPFELIVERLNPIRDPSRAPLFQHSIVLHTETNYKFTKLKELTIDVEDIDSEEAKYDQTWFFELGDLKLKLKLDYCSALFSRTTVETYIKMFIAVAKSLLRATSFDEINYAIESEVIKEIRKNHRCDTPRITLSRILEAQSHRSPTNKMLMWFEGDHNRSITFEEAHKFVFYLADRMQQEAICQFGAPLTSDDCLSILSSENFLSVLSIFAVQLCGCCYCPIDSTNPSKRVDFIRHDSRSKLILICDETYPSVREKLVVNVAEELRKWRRIGNNHKMRGKFNRTNISDLAYIIYTSGSTGQPKGVCVEHRSLVNVLEHTTRFYCIKESQRFYQLTKLSFDASLANTFGSTLNGATLRLRDEDMNPYEDIYRSLPLDVLHMTPMVLKQFSDAEITELKSKLALWSVGGEQLLDLDANKVIEKGIPMIQVYGPTEATVFQTTIKMKMNTPQSSNIGPTISNMFGYVVGDQEQLLPSGVRGEFYMVGENIARGYMNADRIEGVNFTSNKLQTRDENAKGTNSRAYRSGDIAMRLPSSEMIYCGRRDTQIKLKGYRVELGEIEAAVSCLDGVRSCVTIAKNDRLLSFYTGECRLSEHEQLEQLSEVLPHYMIPSKLIRLQQFPLTQNSKIDRKALESYCGQEDGVDLRILGKNDDIQDILRRIWRKALKKDNISVQDNFFALGGHSLMATEICFRIQETLRMKCPTRFIFENQTIEKLAKYLSAEAVTDCAREQHSPESYVENLAGLKHISIGPGKQNPGNERETSKEQTFPDVGNSRDSSTGKPRTPDRKSNSKRSNILMPLKCCDLQNPILHIYYNNPEGLYLRAYETGFRIRLNSIEVPLLQMCLNRILMRHDALRTSFYCDSKGYFQEIHSASECYLAIRYSDPSGSNLFVPSPFKSIPVLSFLEKTNGSVQFILKMSHLITDGRSMQVIAQELHTAYFKRRLLPKNKATYAGFTEMYSEKIEQLKETNEVHWRNIAASIDGSLLETDKPRKVGGRLSECGFIVEHLRKLNDIVQSVSRKNECSDFATMLTAFAVVMSRRFPERSKFVIGCPVDMRENPLENSVGFHVGTAPIVIDPFDDRLETSQLLHRISEQIQHAIQHSAVSSDFLSSLFGNDDPTKCMMVLDNFSYINRVTEESFSVTDENSGHAKYELCIFVSQNGSDITVRFEYVKELFYAETVRDMIIEWARCIKRFRSDAFCIDKYELGIVHNSTDIPTTSFNKLLQNIATLSANNVSLFSNDSQKMLTYSSMLQRIREISSNVQQALIYASAEILRCDSIVPIVSERSVETLLICLSTLFSGVAYLPIDKTNPLSRIRAIIEESGANFYVSDDDLNIPNASLINSEELLQTKSLKRKSIDCARSLSEDIAYTIFTSGTTGLPKGVVIRQMSLMNLALQSTQDFRMSPTDCVYQFTNFCFDNSVLEMIMALSNGSSLLVEDQSFSTNAFLKAIVNHNISHALLFPGLVKMFSDAEVEKLAGLRYWIVGAEKLSQRLMDYALRSGVNVIQNYGPTETTAYALSKQMKLFDHANNLGKPIRNAYCSTRKWTSKQKAPLFTTGELLIGGTGLMRGYLNKTPNVGFCVRDSHDEQRMYASGDVVKQLRNGDILFIGRRDEQVKIRGFRVELTEIEAVICELPDVKQCKVILMQNSLQILVAYFTLRSGSNRSPDVDRIREFCKQRLPHYMIPSYFKELEQFPITKNNKVDITKLPMVSDEDHNQRLKDQPENVVEFRLWLLFKQVLLNESISTVDDFFAIGGNSLRAMLLVQRINEEFSANVSANIIYQYRTIRRIAELLNAETNLHLHSCSTHAQVDDAPSIKIDYHSIPLSFQQQQILFLSASKQKDHYSLLFLQEFDLSVDFKRLRNSFLRLIMRQPSLRTVFFECDYETQQALLSGTECYFCSEIATDSHHSNNSTKFPENISLLVSPDNQSICPVYCSISRSPERYTVKFLLSHIISDAWSTRLIETELSELYMSSDQGRFNDRPLRYTYAHYAVEQNRNREQLVQLANEYAAKITSLVGTKLHSISTIFSGSNGRKLHSFREKSFNSMKCCQRIFRPQILTFKKLNSCCAKKGVTPFVIMIACIARAVHELSKESKILIGAPTANRSDKRTHLIAGNFLNNLLIGSKWYGTEHETINDYLMRIDETVREAKQYETVPYRLLREALALQGFDRDAIIYEVYVNCRYDLEDGATNQLPLPLPSRFDAQNERSSAEAEEVVAVENDALPPTSVHPIQVDVDIAMLTTIEITIRIRQDFGGRNDAEKLKNSIVDSFREILKDNDELIEDEETAGGRLSNHPSNSEYNEEKPVISEQDSLIVQESEHSVHDSLKSQLKSIWKECLSTSEINDDDNFFFVGGNSFLCLKLKRMIQKQLNTSVEVDEIFENAEFMQMFSLLSQKQANVSTAKTADNYRTIVKINGNTDRIDKLVVLFHPLIGGILLPYASLIRRLNAAFNSDITAIGLQHPNTFTQTSADATLSHSIERLCSVYVEQMSDIVQNAQKCIFVGASMGAILAFECAKQLKQKGIRVEHLISIDGGAQFYPEPSITFAEHEKQMNDVMSKYSSNISENEISESVREMMIKNAWQLLEMLKYYHPKRNNDIKLFLLKIKGNTENDYGWEKLVENRRVIEIAGTHETMMNDENSSVIIDVLNDIIRAPGEF